MHTPEIVVSFLSSHRGQGFCDSCIQQSCELESELNVALVTTTLALSPDYRKSISQCGRCASQNKLVTQAV